MMKKQNSTTVTICFVFIASFFFLIFLCDLSVISKFNAPNSSTIQDKTHLELKSTKEKRDRLITCDRSHQNYDICSINGPTILDPKTLTLFTVDPTYSTLEEKIRPYPRKVENHTMKRITEFTLISGQNSLSPKCEVQHNGPALVFSVGGYTGNFWHEFNDGFIPLYITINSILHDQDFILVVSKARDWWINKYADLLGTFSKHPIINVENDTFIHCFSSATLGLISHGFMTINPKLTPNSTTFTHFRSFLNKAYGKNRNRTKNQESGLVTRPRLVLITRQGSVGRVILNQAQVKNLAREIGFDVIVFEPTPSTPLNKAYELINSSHAMVGVHGAALTHSLFLRPGSVFVQVVPLGLGWVSEVCFAGSARAMGLHYMEYRIDVGESSLLEKYDVNDLVIKDPVAYRGENWSDSAMDVYLKEQNIKLDLVRFRGYLEEVYKKAKRFMDMER